MRPDNWFLAIENPKNLGSEAEGHLRRIGGVHSAARRRVFDLRAARQVSVVYAGGVETVETARYWLGITGPRSAGAKLEPALATARTAGDVRRICTSADANDSAFLIVDKEAGGFYAVTDRLNAGRMFHAEIGGTHLLASSMSLFPRQGLVPDTGAIASYLLNGSCLNNHTVFKDIAVLERASVHEFADGGRNHEIYWSYTPGQAETGSQWQPRRAAAALWDLLVQSVDRATNGKKVLLSLSGGYDSGVLLGILHALKHPDVVCFSYVYGAPKHGSDAEVAARQAALYGYRHITVNSYSGDLLEMIDHNARIGQALRCPCYEIEVFEILMERCPDAAERVLLVGDECLGWGSYRLNDVDDILGAINLKSPALLGPFEIAIGAERLALMRDALEAEYDLLRRKARQFANPDDAKDFLYLDQRLQFALMPLRTFVTGHWFHVAMPLISPDILDFMSTVPTAHRIDKRLFKSMGRSFLPELLRIPRASRSQLHPDFDREIAAVRETLKSAIVTRRWEVGELFSPLALAGLVDEFCKEFDRQAAKREGRRPMKRVLKKRLKAVLASWSFFEDRQRLLRRLSYNGFSEAPGREFLLLNLLCLADFLSRGSTHCDASATSPSVLE